MTEDIFAHSNSILTTKECLSIDDYNPVFTNKALSQHLDCIMYVNEMNIYHDLSKQMQYDYYFHAIRKLKRKFSKWGKKNEDEEISIIMKYYNYSYAKAKAVVGILTKSQLSYLKKKMEV